MIKVAICDEEENFAKEVYDVLNNISKKKNIDVIIDIFEMAERFLSKFKDNHYNIVFINVDAKMSVENKSRLDIARYIKSVSNNTQIIFFSRTEKYALDGYDIGISNYLLKPVGKKLNVVDKEKIQNEFLKILDKIGEVKKRLFIIKKKDGIKILNIDDILFFEAHNRVVTVVTKHEKIDFYDKINDLEEKFSDSSFIRCHRGFLINPEYVKEITKDTMCLDYNYIVPVSRLRVTDVKNDIINYLNNNYDSNKLIK